ncbi:MAG: FHA domain-containing protein [Myxococcales bacterium]|nr:FHA domain-containing protein [Myxococcales bacterium]
MFKLVISDDEGKTTVVPLVQEAVTIGRDEANTIRLTERNVSRQHARLERLNGTYAVADLGSYNGVRINGLKIDGTSKLKAGDQIGIGDYLLAFHSNVVDGATDPAAAGLELTDPLATATQDTAILKSPEAGPSPARLVMILGPTPGREFALSEARMRIGRMEEAQVWVNHKSISREHAEVVKVGDGFRIADLRSANGVRVNGRDIKDVELQSGDFIELGQVRFRYVPVGEHYVYDPAESTGQTEALARRERASRAPLYATIAVLSAGLVAVATFYLGGTEKQVVVDPVPTQAAAQPTMSEAQAQARVSTCRQLVDESRFRDAVDAAAPVLAALPGHGGAAACKATAERGLADMELYGRGMGAFAAGDMEAAYSAFRRMSDGSPFLERPEIQQAAKSYAEAHLAAAQQAVRRAPEDARVHAQAVLDMREVSSEWQHAAERILAKLGGAAPTETPDGDNTETPTRRPNDRVRKTPTATPTKTPTPNDGPSGVSVTQQCVASGGDVSACVVRKLANSARTPLELSELIEAYRSLRDTSNMLKQMKRFTELFPNHPKTQAYSQILLRHNGP